MVTQEWESEEMSILTSLGFVLNFKGFFVKDNLTLTKRLDVEFKELYYQVYKTDTGLIINIPSYQVEDGFSLFLESLQEQLSDQISNLDKLLTWLKLKNVECVIQDESILFNNETYKIEKDSDIEKTILYLTINLIK